MKNVKKMNNVEFVQYVMESAGITGPMKQMFIMQAIPQYCKQVIAEKDKLLAQAEKDEAEGKLSVISIPAWIASAEEILALFDKKYE